MNTWQYDHCIPWLSEITMGVRYLLDLAWNFLEINIIFMLGKSGFYLRFLLFDSCKGSVNIDSGNSSNSLTLGLGASSGIFKSSLSFKLE